MHEDAGPSLRGDMTNAHAVDVLALDVADAERAEKIDAAGTHCMSHAENFGDVGGACWRH